MTTTPSLLYLLGSPRQGGNTDILAGEVCRGFEAAGGATERIVLAGLDIRPCTGCMACEDDRPEPCVLDDDMIDLYRKMVEASALLWATPVYYWSPASQLKVVLDRLFPWGDWQTTRHAKALAGRPVGLAVCYADADPATNGFFHAYHILKVAAECSGGLFAGCVHGAAEHKGDIVKRPEVLEQARALGAKLFRMAS